jgi:hypothetical protein
MDDFWRPGLKLAEVEKFAILRAFKFFQGNKTRTALALDIAIRTLDNKLELYENQKREVPPIINVPETRVHLEPNAQNASKFDMSVRVGTEAEKVPPEPSPARNTHQRKSRRTVP